MLWIVLPDINKLFTDPDVAWMVYLTANELLKAFVAAWFVRNVFGYMAALWFVTQAINEASYLNAWPQDSVLEYAAFGVLSISAYLFHRFHERGTGGDQLGS